MDSNILMDDSLSLDGLFSDYYSSNFVYEESFPCVVSTVNANSGSEFGVKNCNLSSPSEDEKTRLEAVEKERKDDNGKIAHELFPLVLDDIESEKASFQEHLKHQLTFSQVLANNVETVENNDIDPIVENNEIGIPIVENNDNPIVEKNENSDKVKEAPGSLDGMRFYTKGLKVKVRLIKQEIVQKLQEVPEKASSSHTFYKNLAVKAKDNLGELPQPSAAQLNNELSFFGNEEEEEQPKYVAAIKKAKKKYEKKGEEKKGQSKVETIDPVGDKSKKKVVDLKESKKEGPKESKKKVDLTESKKKVEDKEPKKKEELKGSKNGSKVEDHVPKKVGFNAEKEPEEKRKNGLNGLKDVNMFSKKSNIKRNELMPIAQPVRKTIKEIPPMPMKPGGKAEKTSKGSSSNGQIKKSAEETSKGKEKESSKKGKNVSRQLFKVPEVPAKSSNPRQMLNGAALPSLSSIDSLLDNFDPMDSIPIPPPPVKNHWDGNVSDILKNKRRKTDSGSVHKEERVVVNKPMTNGHAEKKVEEEVEKTKEEQVVDEPMTNGHGEGKVDDADGGSFTPFNHEMLDFDEEDDDALQLFADEDDFAFIDEHMPAPLPGKSNVQKTRYRKL